MSACNFHLLVNQHGERFIFYKSPNGEKFIEDFAKTPYTAESLFEDIKDEFSAFPWTDDNLENEYDENDILVCLSINDFTLGDEKVFRIHFKEIARVTIGDEAIYIELHTERMNNNEKNLFGELKEHLDQMKYLFNQHNGMDPDVEKNKKMWYNTLINNRETGM